MANFTKFTLFNATNSAHDVVEAYYQLYESNALAPYETVTVVRRGDSLVPGKSLSPGPSKRRRAQDLVFFMEADQGSQHFDFAVDGAGSFSLRYVLTKTDGKYQVKPA